MPVAAGCLVTVADSFAARVAAGMLADCSEADMLSMTLLPGSEGMNPTEAGAALEEWLLVCRSLGRNACFQGQNFRNLCMRAWLIATYWFSFRNSSSSALQLAYAKLNDCNIGWKLLALI